MNRNKEWSLTLFRLALTFQCIYRREVDAKVAERSLWVFVIQGHYVENLAEQFRVRKPFDLYRIPRGKASRIYAISGDVWRVILRSHKA